MRLQSKPLEAGSHSGWIYKVAENMKIMVDFQLEYILLAIMSGVVDWPSFSEERTKSMTIRLVVLIP